LRARQWCRWRCRLLLQMCRQVLSHPLMHWMLQQCHCRRPCCHLKGSLQRRMVWLLLLLLLLLLLWCHLESTLGCFPQF
jgi:hypothetical protein